MPVHYRVYDNNGEATSKTSFDETDTALGRIDVLSIPPPYSVASLKRRLIKAEEISDLNPEPFEDEDSETAMNDGYAITLWAESYPGIIVIVYKAQNISQTDGVLPTVCKVRSESPYYRRWLYVPTVAVSHVSLHRKIQLLL